MFRMGATVVFDPETFNPDFFSGLSEEERLLYYGDLGYGSEKPVLFTFLGEHSPQSGHCILINMKNQKIETMRHTSDFRLATEEEC